jgi:biotin operon repressor
MRTFGVELELKGISRDDAIMALNSVGVDIRDCGYTHEHTSYWKIVSDSSVGSGFEVVSPILEGDVGLAELRKVASALDEAGGRVDKQCGYHVHLGARDLNLAEFKSIVSRYAGFETMVDSFMPDSRRGNQNQFCNSIVEFANSSRFANAQSVKELVSAQRDRYFKVNLQAYRSHGTIEFRQHSGTLSASKAASWVKFLLGFVEESRRVSRGVSQNQRGVAYPVPALRGVLGRLYGLLRDNGDMSAETIRWSFGWDMKTVAGCISKLRKRGVVIRSYSDHGKRYYGLELVDYSRQAAVADSLWNGIDSSVKRFYANRIQEFRDRRAA